MMRSVDVVQNCGDDDDDDDDNDNDNDGVIYKMGRVIFLECRGRAKGVVKVRERSTSSIRTKPSRSPCVSGRPDQQRHDSNRPR